MSKFADFLINTQSPLEILRERRVRVWEAKQDARDAKRARKAERYEYDSPQAYFRAHLENPDGSPRYGRDDRDPRNRYGIDGQD